VKSWRTCAGGSFAPPGRAKSRSTSNGPDGARTQRTVSLASISGAEWEGNFMPALGFRTDLGAPLIDEALPDKPAARAGIRAGDKIIAIDGEPVRSPPKSPPRRMPARSAVTFRIFATAPSATSR
jgi:regulator of sigma E protease